MTLQRKTPLRRTGIARGKPLARGGPVNRVNAKRKRKRRAAHHGSKARSEGFYSSWCACSRGKRHPDCTPGDSQPSHTRHFHGDKTTVIPQSDGCHRSVTDHGWAQWEAATGLDKDELADHYSTQGPDAPHPQETP